MTPTPRIVVVGGGLAGLTAAFRLSLASSENEKTAVSQVVLVEASDRIGGKLCTERTSGFVIEGGADSWVPRTGEVESLAEELGLAHQITPAVECSVRAYRRDNHGFVPFLAEGGSPVGRPSSLLSNPALSLLGRARVRLEPLIPRRLKSEDESVKSFIQRRLGVRAYREVYEPLLGGIFGGDPGELSAQATLAPLVQVEADGGSLIRGGGAQENDKGSARPPILTFSEGMSSLAEALQGSLGVNHVQTSTRAKRIFRDSGQWVVRMDTGVEERCDVVVMATSASAVRDMLSELTDVQQLVPEVPSARTTVVNLAYPNSAISRPLDAHGYLNGRGIGNGVSACTWSSAKFQHRAPPNQVLLRCFIRAAPAAEKEGRPENPEEAVALARDELAGSLAITKAPIQTWVHSWSVPVYRIGHAQRISDLRARLTELPGLHLAGSAYDGASIEAVIRSGMHAATAVHNSNILQETL